MQKDRCALHLRKILRANCIGSLHQATDMSAARGRKKKKRKENGSSGTSLVRRGTAVPWIPGQAGLQQQLTSMRRCVNHSAVYHYRMTT